MGGSYCKLSMKSILMLGGVFLAGGVLAAHFLTPRWHWVDNQLHSVIEALGAFVALSLAAIILFLRKHREDVSHSIWVAGALIGMGILNAFHAAVTPGASFIWLRSTATLLGGLLSVMVWLPDRCAQSQTARSLPTAIMAAAIVSGILLVSYADVLPSLESNDAFTPLFIVMNVSGGLLFLAAAVWFLMRYRASGSSDELLFTTLCLLFGLAGVVAYFSTHYWHIGWWLWHLLQLAAYLMALLYEVAILNRVQNELAATNEFLREEVAERKRIEVELKKSEAGYRTLVEQIPAITYTAALDENSTTTYISPQVEAILGYSQDRYKADPAIWHKKLHPEDREHVLDEVAKSHATGQPFVSEYRMLSHDGRPVWFRDEAVIVRDDSGQPIFLQGVMFNISARKESDEALQNQLRFMETLINTIPNPIFYKNVEGAYVGCNKAFEDFLGLTRDQIIGKGVYDLAPRSLADKYHEMDLALFRQPGVQIYEASVLYADGSIRDVVFYKSNFRDAGDNVAGLIGVMLDITARKRAEEALRRAHNELDGRVKERTAELEKANEELRREIGERKRVEEALRQSTEKLKLFAYSVMHDLKSPAVGTYGLTKLLSKQYGDMFDEKGRKYCEQILKASEHIAELVEKINIFIATKEAPLAIETIRIKELVRTVRDEFSVQLGIREVEWQEPERDIKIRADRLCILRALRNLVDNALKYGGEQLREIRITCEESDDCHILSVSDDGRGIKQEDSREIFELFRRNETSKGTEGTGLGLAIVREIAEQHGGKVWMKSTNDRGATFYISISKSRV